MAGKNRFKQAATTIDFDDPSVLTAVPTPVEEPVKQEAEVKAEEPKKYVAEPTIQEVKEEPKVEEVKLAEVSTAVAEVKVEPKVVVTEPAKTEEVQPDPEKPEVKPAIKDNILEGVIEQKPAGKSFALYLDTDVVAALDKLAKQNKVSRSKALNSLLRNILIK